MLLVQEHSSSLTPQICFSLWASNCSFLALNFLRHYFWQQAPILLISARPQGPRACELPSRQPWLDGLAAPCASCVLRVLDIQGDNSPAALWIQSTQAQPGQMGQAQPHHLKHIEFTGEQIVPLRNSEEKISVFILSVTDLVATVWGRKELNVPFNHWNSTFR